MRIKNPFSSARVPRRDQIFWADREEIRKRLLDFIKGKPQQWSEILLIKGTYGTGKTHALIFANIICKRSKFPQVLLLNPGPSFMDLARRIIDAIGFDEILLACNLLIERDKERIVRELGKKDLSGIMRIEGLTTDRMIRFAFPRIDVNYALILGQAYNNRNMDLARAWLLGKQMTATELGRLNASRSISSDDYAVKILADTLRILLTKYSKLILLLDELEDLSNLSRSNAISYAKSLRRLIDENVPGLKIIFTWTADAFENFQKGTGGFQGKSYVALYDRLAPGLELKELTEEEAVQFIKDYISLVYKGPTENVITEDSIRAIYNKLKHKARTPRNLISYCYNVFEKAIKENTWPIKL